MIDGIIAPIKKELANKKIDLIILPEDMIDIEDWNGIDDEAKNKFNIESGGLLIQAYRNLAKELSANLAATFTTHQNKKTYNTIILFNKNGEITDIYNKSRLTFSSEYWPFGNWQPFYYKWLIKLGYDDIAKNNAVFDKNYRYEKGDGRILKIENNDVSFTPLICLEAHYPDEIKKRSSNADFIIHTSSNRWIAYGTKHFMKLTDNLRKIESVWLKTPIVFNGLKENAGIILPDGKTQFINFEDAGDKNYGIFLGEVRY
jgi:apolipoprotein N-acyltransferase